MTDSTHIKNQLDLNYIQSSILNSLVSSSVDLKPSNYSIDNVEGFELEGISIPTNICANK